MIDKINSWTNENNKHLINSPQTNDISENLSLNNVESNILYIKQLKYLKNKDFMLKNYNPEFSIWVAERYIITELEKRKIFYELDKYGYCMRIFPPHKDVPHLTQWINFGLNSTSVVKIFQNKYLTNHILRQDWFKIPEEYILEKSNSKFYNERNDKNWLLKFSKEVWYPLIVKPHKWERWQLIKVIHSDKELSDFIKFYDEWWYGDNFAIFQNKVEWNEYRVIYMNWEVLLSYKKRPMFIVWDWSTTIWELIKQKENNKKASEEIREIIKSKGYNLSDILDNKQTLQIFEFINDSSEKDKEVPFSREDEDFVKSIAKSFWANYFGLDIISKWEIKDGTIIEINAKPDVLRARKVSPRFNKEFWPKAVDYITWQKNKDSHAWWEIFNNVLDCWLTDEEYKEKINSLKFLKNKSEVLKNKYWIKHGIFILLDELEKEELRYTIDEYWFIITIELPNGKNKIIYNSDYWFDNSTLRRIFEDKIYTSKILRNNNFKVADDMLVVKESSSYSNSKNNIKACLDFAKKNGYPLIFKPNNGSLWQWITKIFNEEQLYKTIKEFNVSWSGLHLLQKYIPGKDYRVIYLDWEILAAYERIPPQIVWDGINTIKSLVEEKSQWTDNHKYFEYLKEQWINIESVLPKWEIKNLLPTANIATWWSVRQVTTTQRDKEFLEKVAKTFWSRYFGIDILSEWELADGYILEINKSPITKWISAASEEFRKTYPQKIWSTIKNDEWF